MKYRFFIRDSGRLRAAIQEIYARALRAVVEGRSCRIVFEDSDKCSDAMRAKFHALCEDIARTLPAFNGARMSKERWKAVLVGALVEQEWLPGIDGRAVPFRPSSEDFSKTDYLALIDLARDFGNSQGVVWSDPRENVFH